MTSFHEASLRALAPHNVLAGAVAVGREGEILRLALGPSLLYTALGGVTAWLLFGL